MMLTGTQSAFGMSSRPSPFGLDSAFHDVIPFKPQSLKKSELIQNQVESQLSAPVVATTYPESAYQWLIEVLDGLIDFGKRHGHYGVIKLTKDEYQWLDDVLEELICSVGEDENHPLAPLMSFIMRSIANYEDAYVPKLTERFPELAEEAPIEAARKNKKPKENTPKRDENELAAHAFFSIGYLLYHGNRTEKTISAYEQAIALKPDFWEASYNLGIARYDLKQYTQAIIAFNKVVELNHNFASAYYNRGIVKSELDQRESAIADFDKVIELDLNRDFVDIHYIKGIVNAHFKQYEEAISDFDEAIRLNPDDAKVYDSRGIVKGLLKRYESAISDHTIAIDIMPDFAEAYAHRGGAKVELENIDEAKSDLQTALALLEQQGNADFKALVEMWLQRLNQMDSKHKNDKQPRRGGQWKGKVKIAEDFNELPESFMKFFDGENE